MPCDGKRGEEIPLGARILKLALDFNLLVTAGNTNAAAMGTIRQKNAWYDPALIESLERVLSAEIRTNIKSVKADELALNMILAEDVKTLSGMLIVAKGHEVTSLLRIRLKNWLKMGKILSHIKVMIPVSVEK